MKRLTTRYSSFWDWIMEAPNTGDLVYHAEAQAEITKRDETIADLKALLYRSADTIGGTGYTYDATLYEDIQKALS